MFKIEKIPSVYDKLFLQAYLSAIKVDDTDKYLEAFRQFRKASAPHEPTTITSIRSMKPGPEPLVKKRTVIVAIPVLLAAIILIIFALSSEKIDTTDSKNVKELPVRAIVEDIPGVRSEGVGEELEDRESGDRLSRAGLPDESDRFATLNMKGDSPDGICITESHLQIVDLKNRLRHGRGP